MFGDNNQGEMAATTSPPHVQNLSDKFKSVESPPPPPPSSSSPFTPPPPPSATTAATTPVEEEEEEEDTPLDILVPLNDDDNHSDNHLVMTPTRSSSITTATTASKNIPTQFYTPQERNAEEVDEEEDDWMNHYTNNTSMASNHSVDLSVDSLDQVDREYLGDARRHHYDECTYENNGTKTPLISSRDRTTTTTSTTSCVHSLDQPWCEWRVADSLFLGFATWGLTHPKQQVLEFVHTLRQQHPKAAHIPYAWDGISVTTTTRNDNNKDNNNNHDNNHASFSCDDTITNDDNHNDNDNDNHSFGYDDDGEPEAAHIGLTLLAMIQQQQQQMNQESNKKHIWLFPEEATGGITQPPTTTTTTTTTNSGGTTAVVIVRYFGAQLLGVTCGRLTQCYQRVAQCTLHRLVRGRHVPHSLDFTSQKTTNQQQRQQQQQQQNNNNNWYGLAAGDTELHLNIIPPQIQSGSSSSHGDKDDGLFTTLWNELDFGGFKGAAGEVLPRLQNLQADFYSSRSSTTTSLLHKDNEHGTIIPVYRYPGNYLGDEWETFRWSPLSHQIKETVEAALPHFYKDSHPQQTNQGMMNHCVTNYYRHGDDYIAHHSDKDLDLNQHSVIVSVSIGAERILELRRRSEPRDTTRLRLPHGSMLLLGPITNQQFTHSIIPVPPDVVHDNDDNENDKPTTTNNINQEIPPQSGGANKYNKDARISLTMRHVSTFMDTTSQRLFGQGVSCKTLEELRRSQRLETIYFGLGFGFLWNALQKYSTTTAPARPWTRFLFPWSSSLSSSTAFSSTSSSAVSNSSSNRSTSGWWQNLAREGLVLLGSVGVAWWTYSKAQRAYHRRQEERAARDFFTRTSTSGTKY